MGAGFDLGCETQYWFTAQPSVHVAAAATLWFDMFNADASAIVRVRSILHTTLIEAAVTGVGIRWQILKTTAIGTGGTGLTAWKADESQANLVAGITARLKGTGGATASASLFWFNRSSEETVSPVHIGAQEMLPELLRAKGLVLRQNQGFRINQESNSNVGNSSISVGFTVE